MRRTQIQQMKQGIKVLRQTHKEIKKQTEAGGLVMAGNLLEQCQQYAIGLGQMIEKEEGEGIEAVGILEDYCEQIYQTYENLRQAGPCDAEEAEQRLCQTLSRLEDAVRNRLPVRKEIVFLPYKASMWDSLESIWRAACEDLDCDAYVIPIPYYDRNPDGSLREMHYEGGQYPDDVPIIRYDEYDFEGRRPDMIFIHNPYDNYNYVTSVVPFFYSENLKKYTDQLVYVPYFVLDEPNPDDPNAEEGIAHFCTCPGVLHADKVIVQSEAMRQIYIRVLRKTPGVSKWQKRTLEKKILGLGSPKTDRILSLKREDAWLPEEWRGKLQKPDGSIRKVIFYNTGIGAFLHHNEKMLEKMKEVFRFFRDRKETVLLWRPHPLLEASIKSMRPYLLTEYQNLTEQYRREGWGIYDDTADLDRAILLCDAYYGDPSSVVRLCKEAGKPVMIQNPDAATCGCGEELLKRPLIFENVYDAGPSLWFTEYEYNALMKMDKKSHRVEYKGSIPGEAFWKEHLYMSAAECGGKLYFAPYWAEEIAEYDLKTKTIRKISVCAPCKEHAVYYEIGRFIRAVPIGKKVYFIPAHYPGIVCYDTEQDQIYCLDDWVDRIEELRTGESWYFIGIEFVGSRLILPCACADAVVIFDILEERFQVLRTPPTNSACKFVGMCYIGDNLYLASADGTISKRKADAAEEEIRRWKIPVSGLNELELYPVRYANDSVWLFPNGNRCAYRIDCRTDEGTFVPALNGAEEWPGYIFLYLSAFWDGNRFCMSRGIDRRFLEYEPESERKREYQLFLQEEDRELLREYKEKELRERMERETITENEADTLVDFLNVLERSDRPQRGKDAERGVEIGRNIYRALREEENCTGWQ